MPLAVMTFSPVVRIFASSDPGVHFTAFSLSTTTVKVIAEAVNELSTANRAIKQKVNFFINNGIYLMN